MLHNFDAGGNKLILFKSFMDHKSTEKAFKKSDGYITGKKQALERRNMTKCWELIIK